MPMAGSHGTEGTPETVRWEWTVAGMSEEGRRVVHHEPARVSGVPRGEPQERKGHHRAGVSRPERIPALYRRLRRWSEGKEVPARRE